LGHQEDGRTGTDEAIGRRLRLTSVLDGGGEFGPDGAGLALKLMGLRMPPNDADAGLDASRRPEPAEPAS
jgi:hypothetical protein